MLRLILVRHAKSAWDDPALADFDRPLSKRGRFAAGWIGETLATRGLVPDRILCSTARRTRETLQPILAALPPETAFVYLSELYQRRDDDYLDLVAGQGGGARTLMLLGHNSATATTAIALSSDRSRDSREALLQFPTGGIAAFELDIDDWTWVRPGAGRLLDFLVPPKA